MVRINSRLTRIERLLGSGPKALGLGWAGDILGYQKRKKLRHFMVGYQQGNIYLGFSIKLTLFVSFVAQFLKL